MYLLFGKGKYSLCDLVYPEEKRYMLIIRDTGEEHTIGLSDNDPKSISPDEWARIAESDDHLVMEFENIKSIDAMIDTLNEIKDMKKENPR